VCACECVCVCRYVYMYVYVYRYMYICMYIRYVYKMRIGDFITPSWMAEMQKGFTEQALQVCVLRVCVRVCMCRYLRIYVYIYVYYVCIQNEDWRCHHALLEGCH